MPFTRISMNRELFETHQQEVSVILQQCLETYFDVPKGDCFQLFDVHSQQQKVFDKYYPDLIEGRNDAGILFHIFAGKPRSQEQKRALYKALCECLVQRTNINKEDVMVILQFNNREDWSFSSGLSASDIKGNIK